MKKIEAIIKSNKLNGIKEELSSTGIMGMTISEVRGFGKQKGQKEFFRGAEYNIEFLPKIKIEIVCNDHDLDKILGIISRNAMTGQIGDGKIFILPVEEVVRIRTGEKGENAVY